MIKFIDLYSQYLSIRSEIDAAIGNTIRESAYIGGVELSNFEKDFACYQQAKYCVGVANGTDAIEISLESLALPPDSEVIVPANSFISSSEAVSRSGYQVIFADIDKDTFTLNLDDVRRRISPRTAAIVAVHLYGHPCDMDGISDIANEYDLKIIEDCAQAHGAEYKGRRVGAIGDIGTFSFYPGKILGAYGDGGAIISNDEKLINRSRMIANHGRLKKHEHEYEGRNSRLDGLQAAILNVKLKKIDEWIEKRNLIAKHYVNALSDISEVDVPIVKPEVRHAFHLFVIRIKRRDELAKYLKVEGVETGIHYPIALPKLMPYLDQNYPYDSMLAIRQSDRLLSLPMGEHLNKQDVESIVNKIKTFFVDD